MGRAARTPRVRWRALSAAGLQDVLDAVLVRVALIKLLVQLA
eukprot:CAMPEP_0170477338 /NCGR_PEP_ID=MMETSP0123-20130129/18637_1 /TAXON_ID=182087 /ORGANISM="Favella ehrenbergii, Strain Fehren 1" /LENGTH=41 /DNA_ID= /DNA_START= /DNA_END= /DNA_ORIENTATION=